MIAAVERAWAATQEHNADVPPVVIVLGAGGGVIDMTKVDFLGSAGLKALLNIQTELADRELEPGSSSATIVWSLDLWK